MDSIKEKCENFVERIIEKEEKVALNENKVNGMFMMVMADLMIGLV